ncbi:ABC transporter permease [Clostridium pasteurianum]|uniref:ABC-type multidrug transport system, permease component n=1 Tax=Clostridium pasteurianum BC1 TaxID=86416 RepID=R4JWV2_CLOPA|nr:ABC transporter permease [Clostridium pasteurianum]AGK95292.1 ABC-type multidrug transport system, permease component [Clostridium pasteurianum BC1]
MNFQRFFSVVKKEFIQIKRDRASLVIAIMMPIMMMILFGYAVNTELDNINTAVLDMSNTTESRELIKSFENTKYFKITGEENNIDNINSEINNGKIHAAIIIPSDYRLKLDKGEKPSVELIIDGSDPTTARTALSGGILTGENYSINLAGKNMAKINENINSAGVNFTTKVLYNPDLKNRNYTIPGLIGLVMQNVTILLTAFALVREKERGTIEQLVVSPLKSGEIILGKLIPYILIGICDFLLSMILGFYYFNVPIRGSMLLLIFLGIGFVICALAIGILISTAAKTQLQAMQMTFMILLPSVLLSGFVFPREAMPWIIRIISYFIPLTYFLNIVRDIVLKGIGINYMINDVIILFTFGIILLVISMVQFRKKLE